MAIALNNNSTAGDHSSGTTITWSHTCSGSDRILIVGVATASVAVSSVTFNGDALTLLDAEANASGPIRAELWYRIAPDSATGNIVVTLASSAAAGAGASSYVGVHQTQPFDTVSSVTGNSATPSNTVAAAVGQSVIDVIAVRTGLTTISVGAGQTQRWNKMAAASTLPICGGSGEAGAASVTMSWSVGDATSKQYASIGVPLRPSGTGLQVLIAGVDKTTNILTSQNRRTLRIAYSLGSDWTCSFPTFDADSTASAYRPALNDTVVVNDDGTTLFSGRIVTVRDTVLGGDQAGTVTHVTARHRSELLERVLVDETYAAGLTLHDILDDLTTTYLVPQGITLSGTVPTGPTLDGVTFDNVSAKDALNRLMDITGYLWRLDAVGTTLFVFTAGTQTASYSITSSNGNQLGPVEWEQTRAKYSNRVTVRYGTASRVSKTDTFTGDGLTTTYPLTYPNSRADFAGYVRETVGGSPVDYALDGATWAYSSGTGTYGSIVRASNLANLATAAVTYGVQFPLTVTAEDSADITTNGLYHIVVDLPDVFDLDQATEFADGVLRNSKVNPKIVRVETREGLELPGTQMTLTFSARGVTGSHIITDVQGEDTLDGTMRWKYTCMAGTEVQRGWKESLRSAIGGGGSTAVSVVRSSGGSSASGAIVPDLAGTLTGDVVANANTASNEVSLSKYVNASNNGAAVWIGRRQDSTTFGLCADNTSPSPAIPRLRIVVPAFHSSARYLAQWYVPSGTTDTIYLTPDGAGGGTLAIGGPVGVFGDNAHRVDVYARDASILNGPTERSRTVKMGDRNAVTFAAGDYTADTGSWTLASGDQVTSSYGIEGRKHTWIIELASTTISGSPNYLKIAIPGSKTVDVQASGWVSYATDNGTMVSARVVAVAGDTFIRIYKKNAIGAAAGFGTWANSTDNTDIRGGIIFWTTAD